MRISIHHFRNHGPAIILAGFSIAVTIVLLCFFPYPPLQDYAEWMYQSYILSFIVSGKMSHLFYIREYPVPYFISQALMSIFFLGIGPALGSKLMIAAYLLLGAVLSILFTKRHQLNPAISYPFLMCVILCNSCFWSGYINYQVGLLVLVAYLSLSENAQDRFSVNLAFSLLAFSSHAFCMLGFVVIGGSLSLAKGWRKALSFGLACVPMMALTIWYLLARHDDSMPDLPQVVPYFSMAFFSYKFYTLTKAGPYQNFAIDGIGDNDRHPIFYIAGVATNVVAALLLLWLIIRNFRWVDDSGSYGWTLAVFCLLLIYVTTPSVAMQVVNPGERVLYPLLICILRSIAKPAKAQSAIGSNPLIPSAIYWVMAASMMSLICSTHVQNWNAATTDDPQNNRAANQHTALYQHKPYDFYPKYESLMTAYQHRAEPILPLDFKTSVLAERPSSRNSH